MPGTQRIEIDGFRIYVLHILAELDPQAADNVDAVIYGHSHQPKIETKNGTLFFNPGSAGPRRFGLPITVGRVTAEHGKLRAEIVELSVEHHRRSIRRRRLMIWVPQFICGCDLSVSRVSKVEKIWSPSLSVNTQAPSM